MTGADIVLAQQQRLLNRSPLSAEDKQKRIDAQKRIHDAVISGKGLELLAPDVRRAVDNVEYQTLLVADPAKILTDVRQPLLIVQGDLDTQVEPPNADRLEALARARKNAKPVEVVKIPGVNHLLMPATTGEVDEYPTPERQARQSRRHAGDRHVAEEDALGRAVAIARQYIASRRDRPVWPSTTLDDLRQALGAPLADGPTSR